MDNGQRPNFENLLEEVNQRLDYLEKRSKRGVVWMELDRMERKQLKQLKELYEEEMKL